MNARTRHRLAGWCLLCCLLLSGNAGAGHDTVGEGYEGPRALPYAVLRDPGGRLSINEVAAPARAAQFVAYPAGQHNIGYAGDVLWMQIPWHNPLDVEQRYYLDVGVPRLRDVRFFLPEAGGGWQEHRSGLEVPVEVRDVESRQPLLRSMLAAHETRTVYVRIASENAIALEAISWMPRDFASWENGIDQVNMLQFGAIFFFAFYMLVLALAARERIYLLFALMLSAQGMYEVCIQQYGHQWLWPQAADWSVRSPGVFLALGVFAFGVVVAELLQGGRAPAWTERLLRGQAWLALALVPPLLWLDYGDTVAAINLLTLLVILTSLAACLRALAQGNRLALLLLLAFALFWATALVRLLQIVGVLPDQWLSPDRAFAISSILGGLVMSGSMAVNVRTLRHEQQVAQQAVLQATTMAKTELEASVRQRTQELQLAKESAEEASAAKSFLLTQMSHEFRTPLHGVLGYTGLMLGEQRNPADRRRLEAIQRSGRHLLALIDDLLLYARLESGRVSLDMHPLSLPTLLHNLVEEMRAFALERGIELHLKFDGALPAGVLADETRLRQVLVNLLSNACRHSRGRHVRLAADCMPGANAGAARICISVADDGVGISAADRARLFELFWQGDAGGQSGGLGMGLPIARQWVRRMGGDLAVDSEPGQGSRFRFCLDLAVVAAPAPMAVAVPLPASPAAGSVPCVLVVDDLAENRELLADMLASIGCRPLLAASAAAGLDCLRRERVDLVLTDQMMPGMSGWEFLLQAREADCQVPFVMVSASPPQPPADWSAGVALAGYLPKPVEHRMLAAEVSRVCGIPLAAVAAAAPAAGTGLVRPSPAAMAALRQAAELGLITDIADWVQDVRRQEPEAASFAEAVQSALARIDLAAIARLAGE